MVGQEGWGAFLAQSVFILGAPGAVIVMQRLATHAVMRCSFRLHALTGMIGAPLHELGHCIACVLFGMRILQVRFFAPDAATGMLGFVRFAYNPRSAWHAIGLLVQGIAPAIIGYCTIVYFLHPTIDVGWLPFEQVTGPITEGINTAWISTVGQVVCGTWLGVGSGALAIVIGLHAIPSSADLRLALRGALVLAAAVAGACLIAQIQIPVTQPAQRVLSSVQSNLVYWGHVALDWTTSAVAMICCVAAGATLLLQVIPAIALKLVRKKSIRNPDHLQLHDHPQPGSSHPRNHRVEPVTIDGVSGEVVE